MTANRYRTAIAYKGYRIFLFTSHIEVYRPDSIAPVYLYEMNLAKALAMVQAETVSP